jgi:hypothetical protein
VRGITELLPKNVPLSGFDLQTKMFSHHVLHLVIDRKSEYREVGSEIKDMRDSSLPAGISCRLLPATDNTWNSQWPQSSLQHWSLLDNKKSKG